MIDTRDLLAITGLTLAGVGLWHLSPWLVLVQVGSVLCGVAVYLASRKPKV